MTASESSISIRAESINVGAKLTGTSMIGAKLSALKNISDEKKRDVINTDVKGVEKISLSSPISRVDAYFK